MTATDLPGLLADAGIRLKRLTPGHSEKLVCPRCDGGRTREASLSVSIDGDAEGAAWKCHRGTCGWQGGRRIYDPPHAPSTMAVQAGAHAASIMMPTTSGGAAGAISEHPRDARPERTFTTPSPHTPEQQANRPEWLLRFFFDRRIGAKTIRDFGVYAMRRWFPEPIGESDAIVFTYMHKGIVANRKYRPFPAKSPQMQERDATPTLYNIDRLGDAPEEVIFVEGEPDVLACYECGFPHAVTLKDGAPARAGDGNDRRFAALAAHAKLLDGVQRFILAGDMDGPGRALREELSRRLGRHRCRLVRWPDGCKDACDTLREHGPEAVAAAIANAAPYPIDGLQDITPGTLLELRHAPPPPLLTTGCRATDDILRLPGEDGRLIVITGIPNHGKSSWLTFLMVHLMRRHGRRFVVFTPETGRWQEYVALCAQVFAARPFRKSGDDAGMPDADIIRAERWLRPRLLILTSDATDDAPSLDLALERTAAAVFRDGSTDLLIDPWNELLHERGSASETDYTGRALQRLRAFGIRHGINIWIVAHPSKPFAVKPGEAVAPPGLYEISGSAHWANKCDIGITVHNSGERTEIHLTKARFSRWGRRGSKATLEFHKPSCRFIDIGAPLPRPGDPVGYYPDEG